MLKHIVVEPQVQGLIFDLDGTLADTMPVHYGVYKDILSGYGVEFSPELFVSMAGIPAIGTFERLRDLYKLDYDATEVGLFKEHEYEKRMHLIRPVEPVVDIVRQYHGKLPMAVGTGGLSRLAWKTLEILGLQDLFEILVASDDVLMHKPHPETFLQCAAGIGVPPDKCLVFEDGKLGFEAAIAAGMTYIDVTRHYDDQTGKYPD